MSPAAFSAEPVEGVQFRAILGMERDDNVLRQPTGTVTDDVAMAGIGLKLDKRVGLQHFRGDIEADTYRYQDLSNLNYSTVNYSAAWDWQVTPAFHGIASADRQQFREVQTDSATGTNVIGRRTTRNELIDATYNIDGAWRALAGVAHTRSSSTDPNSWDASPDINTVAAGAGYEFASGTTASLRYKQGKGEYTQLTTGGPNGFRDHEVEFLLKWPITGKTALDMRLAHISRRHDGAPLRDFDGFVGSAAASWNITGKTQLIAALSRDISGAGQSLGGHVVNNRIYLSPIWHVTAKTTVNARFEHADRTWHDTPPGSFDASRHERVQVVGVGADWEALRWATVSASYRNERLRSSIATSGYRANVFSLAVKAYF